DLDPDSGEFTVETLDEGVSVITLLEDPNGSVWINTHNHGLFRRDPGLQIHALATPQIGQQISALAWFSGQLWLAPRAGGICRLADPASTPLCEGPEPSVTGPIRALAVSQRSSELWAGRRGGGLSRQRDGSVWVHHAPEAGAMGALPASNSNVVRVDSHGGIWIGSQGNGLVLLSPMARNSQAWMGGSEARTGQVPTQVMSLSVTDSRIHIAAQSNGAASLNRRSGQLSAMLDDKPNTDVFAVRATTLGVWIGHAKGVSLVSETSLDWTLSAFGAEIGGIPDLLLEVDTLGMLIGIQGHGLFRLANAQAKPQKLLADQHAPIAVEHLLLVDDQVWLASEQGLHRYDPECDCLHWWQGSRERVHSLARAPDGHWWLALAGKLHVHAPGEEPGPLLREIDWPHAAPGGIAMDDHGRLWAAGQAGLAVLEPDAERPRWLAESLGPIAFELSDRPFEITADGYWFGSKLGILHIDPTQLPPAPLPRRLLVDDISVRRSGKTLTLDASMPATLKATDSDLRIQVRAPLPLDASALHLRSRIEGWDDDWRDLSDGERIIGTLPAGQYRLLLEAWHPADVDHRLSREWTFEVLPPWWRTAPALLLWLALLALILWLWQRLHDRRLQAAHALEVQRQKAEWAQDSAARTNRFLAHLSHEIRNPLSGLLGLLRIAESESDEPKQQQRLALVRSAGQQIAALVEDVLVHARREPLPLRLETLNLQALASEAADRHRPQAQARGIEMGLSGSPDHCVLGDRTRLLQILDNLMGNALKFTERGQIQVGWEASGGQVLLWVQDDGPGIPSDRRETIFAERGQLQADGRGLGLGLSIARQLAEAMGGDLVLADPMPGRRGARFLLRLRTADRQDAPAESAAHIRPPCGNRRWLLVEDDPVQRASLMHELTAADLQVEAASNALTALPQLQADPELGLLTDLGLPEIDGLTLIRMLRAQDGTHHRPILVLTGRVLPEEQRAAIQAGADRVLAKPIEPERLCQVLTEYDLRQDA
ncbi:MAG: response regulator, partial [Xanthomonadales bacterium]|nr:response regulator [Xanthomonadales bacterium]